MKNVFDMWVFEIMFIEGWFIYSKVKIYYEGVSCGYMDKNKICKGLRWNWLFNEFWYIEVICFKKFNLFMFNKCFWFFFCFLLEDWNGFLKYFGMIFLWKWKLFICCCVVEIVCFFWCSWFSCEGKKNNNEINVFMVFYLFNFWLIIIELDRL